MEVYKISSSVNKKYSARDSSKGENSRIAWIDIAKGFTILTVIWGHTLPVNTLARNTIFSFHMPLFFILSGFTMKPAKNFSDFLRQTEKDAKRLLMPTVLFVILRDVFSAALFGATSMGLGQEIAFELFHANGAPLIEGGAMMGALWFLVALFIAKLILRLCSLLFRDDFALAGFLFGFAGMEISARQIQMPLSLDTALVCTMFVAGGALARQHLQTLEKYRTPVFILSAFFLYHQLSNGRFIELAVHQYTLLTIAEGFLASFLVCVLCQALSSNRRITKVFCLIGVSTMPVFLTHYMDGFFWFLYSSSSPCISCILRTFWVLLFAFLFRFLYRKTVQSLKWRKENAEPALYETADEFFQPDEL